MLKVTEKLRFPKFLAISWDYLMMLVEIFDTKIGDRFRQFGFRVAIMQLAKIIIRPIYIKCVQKVFIIPDFHGVNYHDPDLREMTLECIKQAVEKGDFSFKEGQMFRGFLQSGCRGFYVNINEKIAGYAWLQGTGVYEFGHGGKLILPNNSAVVKNVYVFRQFRGRGISRRLNAACLAAIPPGVIPTIFIIPENRYAIRSWERFAAIPVLLVERITWFQKFSRTIVVRLSNIKPVENLISRIS